MNFKFLKFKYIFPVVFSIVISLAIGFAVGKSGFDANIAKGGKVTIVRHTPIPDLDFSLFWKVWDNLNASYFDKSKLVQSKMVYGAISGMVGSLGDPYTLFLQPSQNEVTNQDLQGNFDGVGIEIGYKGTQLAVVAPLTGSPAEKAGVKPGDFIVAIKDLTKSLDITTENLSLAEAVADIRGKAGTTVTLTLIRQGVDKPIVVNLVRESINVPSVTLTFEGKNKDIAHLSVMKFGADTLRQWQQKVQDVENNKDVKGIVLDLRNNPGGYLQDAVDIAAEFLNAGSTAVIQESGDGIKQELKTDREGAFINSKVVVLVNGGSASASEILAGALKDDRKIQLIGEKTFGKGTIQEPIDLDAGAGLHITIAKWLTPNGTWVHGTGLTPDIKVVQEEASKADDQLVKAVQIVESL